MADRLIEADKLKDTLQNLANDDWNQGVTTSWATAFSVCEELVDSMPTIDAVSVIRCRKCSRYKPAVMQCDRTKTATEPYGFCSFAKERGGHDGSD